MCLLKDTLLSRNVSFERHCLLKDIFLRSFERHIPPIGSVVEIQSAVFVWICNEKFEFLDLGDFGSDTFYWKCSHIPLEMLHSRNAPDPETQTSRFPVAMAHCVSSISSGMCHGCKLESRHVLQRVAVCVAACCSMCCSVLQYV